MYCGLLDYVSKDYLYFVYTVSVLCEMLNRFLYVFSSCHLFTIHIFQGLYYHDKNVVCRQREANDLTMRVYLLNSSNQMWILKIKRSRALEWYQFSFFFANAFYLNILLFYTTIPHENSKTSLKEIIHNAFRLKQSKQPFIVSSFG